MEINIKINLDNAAFNDGDGESLNTAELERILRRIPVQLEDQNYGDLEADGSAGRVLDINGNRVCEWEIS